jgi:hypothetical protein
MKAGQKIKLDIGCRGMFSNWEVFEIEEFRHCLGVFQSDEHRQAGVFTPLCELYCEGPESKQVYISNFGEYMTNQVPAWIDCTDKLERSES